MMIAFVLPSNGRNILPAICRYRPIDLVGRARTQQAVVGQFPIIAIFPLRLATNVEFLFLIHQTISPGSGCSNFIFPALLSLGSDVIHCLFLIDTTYILWLFFVSIV